MGTGPSLAGRRFLVTGGAGFVGSHLSGALLARGAHVGILDNFTGGRMDNIRDITEQVELTRIDIRDASLADVLRTAGCETVFHLAGHASVPDSVERPGSDFERNAVATFNLLEAVRALEKRPSIVFASSAAVYGEGADVPLAEDHPTEPLAPYGASKLAAERYMAVYAHVYGLRTASLRFFQIFGPRLRRHVVYDVMAKLYEDAEALSLHGDGSEVRDFMYVENAVAALMFVAERAPLAGEVYNAGDGSAITIAQLAELISSRMGARPRVTYTGSVGAGVSRSWIADVSRLAALGFRQQLTLEEGLDRTVAWLLEDAAAGASLRAR